MTCMPIWYTSHSRAECHLHAQTKQYEETHEETHRKTQRRDPRPTPSGESSNTTEPKRHIQTRCAPNPAPWAYRLVRFFFYKRTATGKPVWGMIRHTEHDARPTPPTRPCTDTERHDDTHDQTRRDIVKTLIRHTEASSRPTKSAHVQTHKDIMKTHMIRHTETRCAPSPSKRPHRDLMKRHKTRHGEPNLRRTPMLRHIETSWRDIRPDIRVQSLFL